jgi:hypothetical protein
MLLAGELAWHELNCMLLEDSNSGNNEQIHTLISKLLAIFPCITEELDEDDEREQIWSEGPLLEINEKDAITIGIQSGYIEESLPTIVMIANDTGYTVFDPQEGKIFRSKN